jgi:hypothetical protein
MNDENLVPNSARTPTERRENARKAGIASGKARRKQADMRKLLRDMMKEEIKDKNGDVYTYAELMTKSILTIAGSPKQGGASVKAYQTVMHILGMDEPEPRQDSIAVLKAILEVNRQNARIQTDEETE